MKAKFTLFAVLVTVYFTGLAQQVPNGGFETWTNAWTPTGWFDTEALLESAGLPVTNSIFTFKNTTTFTQGVASCKLVTDTVPGFGSQIGVIPGIASTGTGDLNATTHQPEYAGIPFAFRPDSLVFDFQYAPVLNDTAAVFISLTKLHVPILQGGFALTTAGSWIHVAIPLAGFYQNNNTPDTLLIQFFSSNTDTSRIGSTLLVDNVEFGYINQPAPPITATATAGGPTTFCNGDSVQLTANTGTNYTYQWDLAGTAITGATASTYWAKAAGSYTVVIDSASSTATSSAIVVTDTNCTTGINNIQAANLSVYPNPATTLLNINSNENLAGFNLQMFDIVGRLVLSQVLEGNSNAINVAKLSNGTYIYRVTDKESGVVAQSKFNIIK
jgi:type IX secretion system substrate protein